MSIHELQLDHAQCTAIAAEMLGGPVRAVVLDRHLEWLLLRRARRELRRGIGADQAIVRFQSDRQGHDLAVGAEQYVIDAAPGMIRVVKIVAPHRWTSAAEAYEFWAVAAADYRRLYRLLRRSARRRQHHAPPLMPQSDKQWLWQSTIGFLKQTQHRLRELGVPVKRGVLLLGQPGNGKTMACRWLRGECNRRGLAWRNVSAEQFESARSEGEAHSLFSLDRPGVVFFDDVDMAIRERNPAAPAAEASTFLSGMDGLDLNYGVVYIFTTNATLAQLDSAFLRPGRIDLVLEFKRPDAGLRRQLIAEHWHADIVEAIDIDAAVRATDGLSFAELDEIKRLMVLDYFETGAFDWDRAWAEFRRSRGKVDRPPIGFGVASQPASSGRGMTPLLHT